MALLKNINFYCFSKHIVKEKIKVYNKIHNVLLEKSDRKDVDKDMRMSDCSEEEKKQIIGFGFSWCGADGFVCHMSHYKSEDGCLPCDTCPRKADWLKNGVYELPNGFQKVKQ